MEQIKRILSHFPQFLGVKKNTTEEARRLNETNYFTGFLLVIVNVIGCIFTLIHIAKEENLSLYHRSLWLSLTILFLVSGVLYVFFFLSLRRRQLPQWAYTLYLDIYIAVEMLYGLESAVVSYSILHSLTIFYLIMIFSFLLYNIKPIISLSYSILSYLLVLLVNNWENMEIHLLTFLFIILGIVFISWLRYFQSILSIQDEIKNEEYTKKIRELSLSDPLTGVRNRYALKESYGKNLNQELTILMFDIDEFKQFNDNYGHEVGDEVLVALTEELSKTFDKNDIYRYGGDEFLVITREKEDLDFSFFTFSLPNKNLTIEASCGRVEGSYQDQKGFDSLMKKADDALYQMKKEHKKTNPGLF